MSSMLVTNSPAPRHGQPGQHFGLENRGVFPVFALHVVTVEALPPCVTLRWR
jgi:hypothetical protein